ncbi:MAG: hypothetical protein WCT41_02540 [Candidatus Paceibacterota bacterium]|jgi:hypothetical protein
MKKYLFTSGAFALAIAMSGLPAIAAAENNDGEGSADTQITAVTQVRVSDDVDTSVTGSARVNDDDDEATSSNRRNDNQATSSKSGDDNESINDDQNDQDEFEFELEDDKDTAFSLDDLNQKIENRKLELEDEEASTTEQNRGIVKNANEVRLAVHALLASKDLIGDIGPKVSEIAKEMNDSVATTTKAEAKIQSRSFLARLFFGGDSAAANVISQAVAQNQQRITDLNKLLVEASVSADIQVVLKAQIEALEDAQARLQDLAQREQKMWGLFIWRF